MNKTARLGKLLIGAAVIVPALAVAGLIVESHYFLIHIEQKQLLKWLAVDAGVLILGLMLSRGEDL
ncbi:hypothetical protein [Terriglobus sp. TAA 43]|uniref:hypothetical protein n=1 Tax=Terriglobus sp. TAA 43 TaxID=278961 RepID=UPI00064622AA|nr:hypothetical protein [Terriglobus sp. TAA 43]